MNFVTDLDGRMSTRTPGNKCRTIAAVLPGAFHRPLIELTITTMWKWEKVAGEVPWLRRGWSRGPRCKASYHWEAGEGGAS
jgi:hypothetical protein